MWTQLMEMSNLELHKKTNVHCSIHPRVDSCIFNSLHYHNLQKVLVSCLWEFLYIYHCLRTVGKVEDFDQALKFALCCIGKGDFTMKAEQPDPIKCIRW